MDKKQKAKELLVHYFSTLFRRIDRPFDADMQSEIEDIVEFILDESKEYTDQKLKEIKN